MNASRFTPVLPVLCLLLAAASATAGNRETPMHGPSGDGGECTPADAAATPDVVAAAPVTAVKPGSASAAKASPPHVKPVTVRGGSDDGNGVHAPRWHSFLPGMFR